LKATFVRLTTGVFTLIASAVLFAQSGAIRVTVPFEFVAGEQKMPAGEYNIEETGPSGTLILHALAGKQTTIVTSGPGFVKDGAPGLTFERHGDTVYLSRVHIGGASARLLTLHVK